MSKFAYFNPHDGHILQWIDTDAMAYNLPDASMLHTCSDPEWDLQHQGEMMIKDGAVVLYIEPEPDPTEARLMSIRTELARIDVDGARASRAVALAMARSQTPAAADLEKLEGLEERAAALRADLRALT